MRVISVYHVPLLVLIPPFLKSPSQSHRTNLQAMSS